MLSGLFGSVLAYLTTRKLITNGCSMAVLPTLAGWECSYVCACYTTSNYGSSRHVNHGETAL